jgi:hypothetical protein
MLQETPPLQQEIRPLPETCLEGRNFDLAFNHRLLNCLRRGFICLRMGDDRMSPHKKTVECGGGRPELWGTGGWFKLGEGVRIVGVASSFHIKHYLGRDDHSIPYRQHPSSLKQSRQLARLIDRFCLIYHAHFRMDSVESRRVVISLPTPFRSCATELKRALHLSRKSIWWRPCRSLQKFECDVFLGL